MKYKLSVYDPDVDNEELYADYLNSGILPGMTGTQSKEFGLVSMDKFAEYLIAMLIHGWETIYTCRGKDEEVVGLVILKTEIDRPSDEGYVHIMMHKVTPKGMFTTYPVAMSRVQKDWGDKFKIRYRMPRRYHGVEILFRYRRKGVLKYLGKFSGKYHTFKQRGTL